jgi:hypothetical protein
LKRGKERKVFSSKATNFVQGLPRLTRFLENIVAYLPEWRKTLTNFQAVPWHYFVDHVRMNINPLAADDHMKEIIQQLQLMGEVMKLAIFYMFKIQRISQCRNFLLD